MSVRSLAGNEAPGPSPSGGGQEQRLPVEDAGRTAQPQTDQTREFVEKILHECRDCGEFQDEFSHFEAFKKF